MCRAMAVPGCRGKERIDSPQVRARLRRGVSTGCHGQLPGCQSGGITKCWEASLVGATGDSLLTPSWISVPGIATPWRPAQWSRQIEPGSSRWGMTGHDELA